MTEVKPVLGWEKVSPQFGSAYPHGSCNAITSEDGVVCGYPRRSDGTCLAGHPEQPKEDRG